MNKRWLRSPKRWSPLKGFREAIISESGVRRYRWEQVERDDWEAWGQKESVPFETVPFTVEKRKRPVVRTLISIINP